MFLSGIPYNEEVIDLSISRLEDLSVPGNPFFLQRLLSVLKKRERDLLDSFGRSLSLQLNEKYYTKWRKLIVKKQVKIDHAKDLLEFQDHLLSLQRKTIQLFSKLSDKNLENLKLLTEKQPLFFEQVFDLIPLSRKLKIQFYDMDTTLEEIVMKRATAGLFEVAIPLTLEIQDPLKKDHARAIIAIEMGKRGKINEALTLTETMTEELHRGFVHWKFSVCYAKDGKINEAFKLANTIQYPIYNQMALSEIYDFSSQHKEKLNPESIRINNNFRDRIFKQIRAKNTPPPCEKKNPVPSIEEEIKSVCQLIYAGKFQEALTLTNKKTLHPDPQYICRFLCEVSSKLAQHRKFEEARALADTIPRQDYKECAYVNLSTNLAWEKNFSEAMALVKTITNDIFRNSALAEISRAYARFCQFEEAQNATNMIDNIHFKKEAYNK